MRDAQAAGTGRGKRNSERSAIHGVFGEANHVIFQLQFEEWFLEEPVTEFRASGRMTATISAGGLSGFLDGDMARIVTDEAAATGSSGAGLRNCGVFSGEMSERLKEHAWK